MKLFVYSTKLFTKEISLLSHTAIKLLARQYLQGFAKKEFWAIFRRKIQINLSINSTFFTLETQNK